MMVAIALTVLLLCLTASLATADSPDVVDVAPVWSGHPVGFHLVTRGNRQYVAFYDANRRMTVAVRNLNLTSWRFHRLPETVDWDSHNYITFAFDREGYIHLSGNMHGHKLKYFKSAQPEDIFSLEKVEGMVSDREGHATYPQFFTNHEGDLIFTYRDGGSGKGDQLYNIYDTSTRQWRRLLETPFTDGEGLMNAYFNGPHKGPDGWFHIVFMWRDTPDCATNHDISYARSQDLVHWEDAFGNPLTLPITLSTSPVVDPVPAGGGLINFAQFVGFDSRKQPVITYHKYDENGYTQVYLARPENGQWARTRISDWEYRWGFQGGGSIIAEIFLAAARPGASGTLEQSFRHDKYGSGIWILDEKSLQIKGTKPRPSVLPKEALKLESDFPGMELRTSADAGMPGAFMLRWETLPTNRDAPRPEPWPAPSMLRVYRLGGG